MGYTTNKRQLIWVGHHCLSDPWLPTAWFVMQCASMRASGSVRLHHSAARSLHANLTHRVHPSPRWQCRAAETDIEDEVEAFMKRQAEIESGGDLDVGWGVLGLSLWQAGTHTHAHPSLTNSQQMTDWIPQQVSCGHGPQQQ